MTLANDAHSPSDADNQHSVVSLGRMTYSLDLILLVYARGRFALETPLFGTVGNMDYGVLNLRLVDSSFLVL